MDGITFGNKHSFDEWGLLIEEINIEDPEPKTMEVDIFGSDGKKDLTEFFGKIRYNNRMLSFTFSMLCSQLQLPEIKKQITNYLHGRKLKIILDNDSTYYYYGRCRISDFTNDFQVPQLTVECDCDPWKYFHSETVKTFNICSFARKMQNFCMLITK